MYLEIYKDYETLSLHVADEIIALVKRKPSAVLCLAAGDTPRLTYALLARKAHDERMDFSQCTFIGLDEWVGIPPTNEGSCHFFLKHHLFEPLHILSDQIHLFDSLSENIQQECIKMDAVIRGRVGGIDLMVVGVGLNGHIGFNEPGVKMDSYSHVIQLDATTQAVGQKYFHQPTKIEFGITLGLQHLMNSRKVILMASGTKKAEVIRKAMEDSIGAEMPASIIRNHPLGMVLLDEDAASLMKRN
ncbi:MAG: glucosamine-6-phosphate deaminase [Cyclobacteriaceae bacterium]